MSKTAFEKAKDFIIKAGFSHIKIEMEADLGREDNDYECDECYGEGYIDCCECEGTGVVIATRPNGTTIEVECEACDGEGRIECEECNGSGRMIGEDNWDTETCGNWIKDYVSDKARQALTYSEFYYDGSVDSEMTLTLPVKNAEYLEEYLEAFKALSEEIGNGLETGGAGLHITVIPAVSYGSYPAPYGSLDSKKWNNFQQEVTKLLPALYMLASADDISRPLSYRKPQVSDDEKYSAIYAYHTASIEYRLFETCYHKPEMIKEYIEVIANTLKFYDNPNLRVKNIGKEFLVPAGNGGKVSRFYQTPDSIMILRNQLKYLKPEGKSISELMKSRKVPNITELKKLQSAKKAQLRREWYKDKKRIETIKTAPFSEIEEDHIRRYMLGSNYTAPMTREQAENYIRGISPLAPLTEYLNSNLTPDRRSNSYVIAV